MSSCHYLLKSICLILTIVCVFTVRVFSQADSLKIIVLDFLSQNLSKSYKHLPYELPRSLEKKISDAREFYTVKREAIKSKEKSFTYNFEPLSFDTLLLDKLRAHRQIDVVVFGKLIQTKHVLTVCTKSVELKDYTLLDSSSITIEKDSITANLDDALSRLAASISSNVRQSYFQTESSQNFKVVFVSPSESETSSSARQFTQTIPQIIDSLNARIQSWGITNVDILRIDSTGSSFKLADVLDHNPGQTPSLRLIVRCRSSVDTTSFQPVITIIDTSHIKSSQQDILSAALGQPTLVTLPIRKPSHFNPLIDFLTGYFLLREQKFTSAIQYFKAIENRPAIPQKIDFAANFYLADAYLKRGKSNSLNIALAQADWDTARWYFQECIRDSSALSNQRDLIWVYNNLGVVRQLLGDLDAALQLYEKALQRMIDTTVETSIIRIYNNIGNIYLFQGQWSKALDTYKNTITTIEQLNDKQSLAITYDNMGNIYQLLTQSTNAITYYEKSLSLREELNDDLSVAMSCVNLAEVYIDKKDYGKALEYYKQELTLNEKLHNEPRIARSYENLGKVYRQKGELDSAVICTQKSMVLMEMIGDEEGLISSTNQLAAIFFKQGKWDRSLQLYENNLSLAQRRNDEHALAKIFDHMADIYNFQQKLNEALDYYKKSAELHEKLEYTESLTLILFNMGLIHLKLNQFHDGYQLIKRAMDIDEQHGFYNLKTEKEFLRNLEAIMQAGQN